MHRRRRKSIRNGPFLRFLDQEEGAVTVEFLVLTAAIVGLAIGAFVAVRSVVFIVSAQSAAELGSTATGRTPDSSGMPSSDGSDASGGVGDEKEETSKGKKYGKHNNPGIGKALGR